MQAPQGRQHLGCEVVVRDEMKQLAIELEYGSDVGAAQPDGIRHDGVKDRLDIRRRAADDPQDLRRRRLLLQRLA
jgi:hypothetical protein